MRRPYHWWPPWPQGCGLRPRLRDCSFAIRPCGPPPVPQFAWLHWPRGIFSQNPCPVFCVGGNAALKKTHHAKPPIKTSFRSDPCFLRGFGQIVFQHRRLLLRRRSLRLLHRRRLEQEEHRSHAGQRQVHRVRAAIPLDRLRFHRFQMTFAPAAVAF